MTGALAMGGPAIMASSLNQGGAFPSSPRAAEPSTHWGCRHEALKCQGGAGKLSPDSPAPCCTLVPCACSPRHGAAGAGFDVPHRALAGGFPSACLGSRWLTAAHPWGCGEGLDCLGEGFGL